MTRTQVLGVAATILSLGISACSRQVADHKPDPGKKAPAESITVSRNSAGNAVVTLSGAARANAALEVVALATVSAPAQAIAYGRIVEDPAGSFTLTAPVAGTVEARSWPGLGTSIKAGAEVGSLVARLAPADRLRLAAQFETARGDVHAAQAAVDADRWNLKRVRALNANHKILADSDVRQAHAALAEDLAHLSAARQTRRLLKAGIGALGGSAESLPLVAEQTGEVVQVLATPGEAVQAGQALLKIADLHRLLARVVIPAGEPSPQLSAPARIVPISDEHLSIPAVPIALGVGTDVETDGEVRIFRLGQTALGNLRPGLAVTAYLDDTSSRSAGVVIPAAALVFKDGRPFAYVAEGKGVFVRRAVQVNRPVIGGYFTSGAGFQPGARLVESGAQALLSEEFRSHFKAASS